MTTHTLRYASSRAEIWRWTWRAWAAPKGRWRLHAGIALAEVAFTRVQGGTSASWASCLFAGGMVFVACVIVSSLWPQIRFKAAERVLRITPDGWRTQIGELTGVRSWSRVRSIEDRGDEVVITGTNGNALIVPRRAFADDASRRSFVEDAMRWHEAARAARS